MIRKSWYDDDQSDRHDEAEEPTPCARNPIRRSIVSLFKQGLLCVIALSVVAWAFEPVATDEESPTWSVATGHTTGVRAAAFSRDSRWLATSGENGSVLIWEVGKGAAQELFNHRQSMVSRLAFSVDGETVAAGHVDGTITLWDLKTGNERARLAGHVSQVMSLDFSPDGATLASAGDSDQSVRLWDAASGKITAILRGHPGPVHTVRFAPDGRTIASGCGFGLVKLWDVSSGQCRVSLERNSCGLDVRRLAFSPDGSTLAGVGLGDLKLWDVATGHEQGTPRTEDGLIREMGFSADGRTLFVQIGTQIAHLKSIGAQSEQTTCLGNRRSTLCTSLSADGQSLALGDVDGTVRVWDLNRFVNRKLERPIVSR